MRFGQAASTFYEAVDHGRRPDSAAAAATKAVETSKLVQGAAGQLKDSLGDSGDMSDDERYEDLFGSATALYTTAQLAAVDAYRAVEMITRAARKSGVELRGAGGASSGADGLSAGDAAAIVKRRGGIGVASSGAP